MIISIDPCGRTPNKLCDHKGRMVDVLRLPAGRSGALPPPTRGLAEWHPIGCFLVQKPLNKDKTQTTEGKRALTSISN